MTWLAVTSLPESLSKPVAGRVATVMLARESFSGSVKALMKSAAVKVTVVSSKPLLPMAASVGVELPCASACRGAKSAIKKRQEHQAKPRRLSRDVRGSGVFMERVVQAWE